MPTATGFQQDEDSDEFGTGTFTFDDGTTGYFRDPDMARDLVTRGEAAPPATPNTRTADFRVGRDDPGAPEAAYMTPELTAEAQAAKARGESHQELVDGLGAEPGATAEPEQAATAEEQPAPAAPQLPLAQQGAQTRESASVSRSRSGALPADMVQRQQQELEEKKASYLKALDDQRFREASAMANRAAEAQKRGIEKEVEGAAARKQEADRRNRAKERSQQVAEIEVNPRRAWEDAGSLNRVLGSIGVFLGGLSAYMRGGQNSALQNIQAAMKADTQAQVENKNSQVAFWTRELGSAEAGIAAAETKKWQGVKEQLAANLEGEKSQEILARGQVLMQQVDLQITEGLQKLEREAYGNEVISEQQSRDASMSETRAMPAPVKGGGGAGGAATAKQLWEGVPEQEAYVGKELADWAKRQGLTSKQARDAWVKYTSAYAEGRPAEQAVNDSLAVIEPYRSGGDVPGEGAFAEMLPNWWVGKEGTRVRQNLQAAVSFFQKEISGASVTEEERALLTGLVKGSGNFDDIQSGLSIVKRIRGARYAELDNAAPGLSRIRQGSSKIKGKTSAGDIRSQAVRRPAPERGGMTEGQAKAAGAAGSVAAGAASGGLPGAALGAGKAVLDYFGGD